MTLPEEQTRFLVIPSSKIEAKIIFLDHTPKLSGILGINSHFSLFRLEIISFMEQTYAYSGYFEQLILL